MAEPLTVNNIPPGDDFVVLPDFHRLRRTDQPVRRWHEHDGDAVLVPADPEPAFFWGEPTVTFHLNDEGGTWYARRPKGA